MYCIILHFLNTKMTNLSTEATTPGQVPFQQEKAEKNTEEKLDSWFWVPSTLPCLCTEHGEWAK